MKVLLFSGEAWNLYNYRLPLAKKLRAAGHTVELASGAGPHAEQIEAAGFRHHVLPITRSGLGLGSELRALTALVRLYRRVRPDVTHHFTMKGVLYGSTAAHLAGVRGIVNSITGMGHGFQQDDWRSRLLWAFLWQWHRWAFRGTHVIFQNRDDRRLCEEKGVVTPVNGHLILGSGVDMEAFAPAPEPEEGPPVVLMAARMLWTKGVATFAEAAHRLGEEEGVEARFALAGEPDEESDRSVPRAQLEAWDRAGVLEWWGHQDDMGAALAKSHVFCLPSAHREGLPRALPEASACGRPVVTTDNRGCREAVWPEENGLMVPVNDSAALAAALRRLVEDGDQRRHMGARGRELAEEHFSMKRVAEQTMNVYEQAAAS